eukprot:1137192-Pelagomonas_calceolata.AAC.3
MGKFQVPRNTVHMDRPTPQAAYTNKWNSELHAALQVTSKSFNFAAKHKLPFFFVSASDGTNVVKIFQLAIRMGIKYQAEPKEDFYQEVGIDHVTFDENLASLLGNPSLLHATFLTGANHLLVGDELTREVCQALGNYLATQFVHWEARGTGDV